LLKVAPYYRAEHGAAYVGDSRELLGSLASSSVDLVMTSPPFALRRKKTYGNVDETEYVDWLIPFARDVHRVLKDTGSFVLDLGGAYRAGIRSRSLYNFRVLIAGWLSPGGRFLLVQSGQATFAD
jgi:site-specific DNA-methyltransferase (cytosine-N4-specific)